MSEPFHDRLQQAGAQWGEYLGTETARDFGNPLAEYQSLRTGVGMVECAARTQIELTGSDRAKFLHNLCTNEIRKLSPGQGCEALLLDARGHVQFHVLVYVGDENIVLDTVPGQGERLYQHLDRYLIREQVELHDRSVEWADLLIAGASARELLERGLGVALDEPLVPHHHRKATWSGSHISVRNLGDVMTRSPAWLVSVPRTVLADAWQTFVAAGARPCGAAAYDTCRIQARWPMWGVDINDKNLPQELARDAQLISFVKGCYIGQETVARIDALGHVNRLLVCVAAFGDVAPKMGDELTLNSQVVGQVTSVGSIAVPVDSFPIISQKFPEGKIFAALAYIKRGYHDPATILQSPTGQVRVIG